MFAVGVGGRLCSADVVFPVMMVGDFVAHVKFTVLLMAGGTIKVTGLEMPAGFANPDKVTFHYNVLLFSQLCVTLLSNNLVDSTRRHSGNSERTR